MFTKIWKSINNPELLIGKTVCCKDGRVFDIKEYRPDRGFIADELIYTDTDGDHMVSYPGYLTKTDVSYCKYWEM